MNTRGQQSGILLSYKSKYLDLDPSKPTTEKSSNSFLFASMVPEKTSKKNRKREEILSNKYLECRCRSKQSFSKSHPENIFVESTLSKNFERSHDMSYVWRMLVEKS
ncbi:hypothetical protein ACOMHN_054408 [Nucella lapillus]